MKGYLDCPTLFAGHSCVICVLAADDEVFPVRLELALESFQKSIGLAELGVGKTFRAALVEIIDADFDLLEEEGAARYSDAKGAIVSHQVRLGERVPDDYEKIAVECYPA